MKIRTDFVTNSSSSSFILARKGELSERQKEIIIKYVEEEFLGELLLKADSKVENMEEFLEENYLCERYSNSVKSALEQGKDIYSGRVSFECAEYSIGEFYESLWEKLEETDKDSFEIIDGRLEY